MQAAIVGQDPELGRVAEWFKAAVLKAVFGCPVRSQTVS
jgi:hypothetical protein